MALFFLDRRFRRNKTNCGVLIGARSHDAGQSSMRSGLPMMVISEHERGCPSSDAIRPNSNPVAKDSIAHHGSPSRAGVRKIEARLISGRWAGGLHRRVVVLDRADYDEFL